MTSDRFVYVVWSNLEQLVTESGGGGGGGGVSATILRLRTASVERETAAPAQGVLPRAPPTPRCARNPSRMRRLHLWLFTTTSD